MVAPDVPRPLPAARIRGFVEEGGRGALTARRRRAARGALQAVNQALIPWAFPLGVCFCLHN